jgi:hypothetical protein
VRSALTLLAIVVALAGCREVFWRPEESAPRPSDAGHIKGTAYLRFAEQFKRNRTLPVERRRRVVILVMTPAYGTLDQIRAGNMGHAAIEINGRLHDMGSLNGYAFTLRPSTAVRFWPWQNAQQTLIAICGHPDSDGWLDGIARFDVTVTDEQATRLQAWWDATEQRMKDVENQMYFWYGLQCASAVAQSLRAAGVTYIAPLTPIELRDYLMENLRDTCGPTAGNRAAVTVVQAPQQDTRRSKEDPSAARELHMLLNWPAMFSAGERSPITFHDPDGVTQPVLWSDSDGYRRYVRSLKITPAEAVRLVTQADPDAVAAAGVQAVPNFAVGPWYHIDGDHIIGQAALGGWYLNGNTAEVVRRDDPAVIRFDTFFGDRAIQSPLPSRERVRVRVQHQDISPPDKH